jgi:hypothetical protein
MYPTLKFPQIAPELLEEIGQKKVKTEYQGNVGDIKRNCRTENNRYKHYNVSLNI